MSSDYSSTVRALALPVSPPRSPNESGRNIQAPWTRRRSSQSLTRNNYSQRRGVGILDRTLGYCENIWRQWNKTFEKLSPVQKTATALVGILTIVFAILFLIFSESFFVWLKPYAERWQKLEGGWLILWFMCFATAFPPVIGYSTCLTLAGFVYGFPGG